MKPSHAKFLFGALLALTSAAIATPVARAGRDATAMDAVRKRTELQIRNLLDPLLDKYCPDQCKLMSVESEVDLSIPDELAPGFSDTDPRAISDLEASSARVKILLDDKIGPNSRTKLIDLVQQYVDTLEYPVRIDTQLAHFPQPIGSAEKVAELRDQVSRKFRETLDELFKQFCPETCLLADYKLNTEVVNPEESQYGHPDEFFDDGGVSIRVKSVEGTLLLDESMPPEERDNITAMAKLRTAFMRNVTLTPKTMKFPRPTYGARGAGGYARGLAGAAGEGVPGISSEEKKSSTSELTSDSRSNSTSTTENTNTSALNRTEQNQSNQSLTSTENSTSSSRDSSSTNTSSNNTSADKSERTEVYNRIEKIERVESGDAIQKELEQFKVYGLVLACSILALLVFTAFAAMRPRSGGTTTNVSRVIQELASDPVSASGPASRSANAVSDSASRLSSEESAALLTRRLEIEQLRDELMRVFAEQPKVARHVFSRLLTEDGVETVSAYIHIFGESIVMDMLRDPSLQADMSELMEFHAKNSNDLTDEDRLELLRKLHNRTVSGKLFVMGSRSSHLFDFLGEMDGLQIMELVRNESLTVKAMVLTQCDLQKRSQIYAQIDNDSRMNLLTELSRIDYLPRDYILNAAAALKRKKRDNPRLNTEALPGSEVLLTLLERTSADMARVVVRNLELNSPDVARTIKSRLVTLDTLRHLRDGQLLELVLSLRHDELLQFLKNAPAEVKATILSKSPKDLVAELEEELETIPDAGRDNYQAIERKLLNRIKLMANEGQVNLVDTNDRMMSESQGDGATRAILAANADANSSAAIKRVSGW